MTTDKPMRSGWIERLLEQLSEEKFPEVDLWPKVESAVSESSVWSLTSKKVEPDEDLWPAIESRIRQEHRSTLARRANTSQRVSLLAACLAVVAIAGFGVLEFFGPGDWEQPPVAGSFYLPAAINEYGSDAQATYRENIALVQEQRVLIEASLAIYPTDPKLRELWRHAYESELKLIDAAGRALSTI